MEGLFKGKVCLVTGAARGIGKAVCEKFAEYGSDLVMMDIQENLLIKSAADIAKKFNVSVHPITMDAMKTESIYQGFSQALMKVDSIDVLANCVGISTSKILLQVEEHEWDQVLNINLRSVFTLSKLFAQNIINAKKKGKIVSISSQASLIGEYGNGTYAISKAGINMLTQVLALELAQHGVSVSAVCPGYVNTEMMQDVFEKRGPLEGMTAEEYEHTLTSSVPMKRMADPSEIAELIAYLASDKADYITGVTITIAGGKTLI
ncbi:MAG: SDR family oxidoreductase [Bacillota bacterium]|nr:SDR family oxidoreductase [Bacillota bacterium]